MAKNLQIYIQYLGITASGEVTFCSLTVDEVQKKIDSKWIQTIKIGNSNNLLFLQLLNRKDIYAFYKYIQQNNANLQLSCNCPDFIKRNYKYIQMSMQSLYKEDKGLLYLVDPDLDKKLCKHLWMILTVEFFSNIEDIYKDILRGNVVKDKLVQSIKETQ
jgi:hypothetical protein